jgi:hypothetical protein
MKSLLKQANRIVASVLAATALGAGGFMVGSAIAADSGSSGANGLPDGTDGAMSKELRADFPTNANGQSFGTDVEAVTPDDIPDLVLVVATNGEKGYVNKAELQAATGANVSTPQEAVAWQREMDSADWTSKFIPVYELDGMTRIGVFEISRSQAIPVTSESAQE